VGNGMLIVCGLNLDANDTGARMFKRALWRYAASDKFRPKWTLDMHWFENVFLPGKSQSALAKDKAHPRQPKLDADTKDMMNNN
ncbi:MAG: hypothetical protein II649_03020, partial [Kiritimatiellae bacterium]|nr:hypothetical protein [Kiritimatiellia bacterium]